MEFLDSTMGMFWNAFKVLLKSTEAGADRVMDNFESYSVKYANWFMYGFILFLVGKFVKINLKVDTSKK